MIPDPDLSRLERLNKERLKTHWRMEIDQDTGEPRLYAICPENALRYKLTPLGRAVAHRLQQRGER